MQQSVLVMALMMVSLSVHMFAHYKRPSKNKDMLLVHEVLLNFPFCVSASLKWLCLVPDHGFSPESICSSQQLQLVPTRANNDAHRWLSICRWSVRCACSTELWRCSTR
jgi:hypothetical protein